MNESTHAPDFPYDFQWINTVQPLSLYDDLQGYVVLVHFWTASNVHCHHVFETLAYLEQRFADRSFMVVGVHTGKFTAERDADQVRYAVRRFGLRHPVVVDEAGEIWKSYEARAWPFTAIVDATGQLRFSGAGELDRERTANAIEFLLEDAAAAGDEPYSELHYDECDAPVGLAGLRFPSAVALDRDGVVWIADAGHHRILGVEAGGQVQEVIGTGEPGAADGSYAEASFFHPQAIHVGDDGVVIADSGNHLLRRIDRAERRVDTILGTTRPVVDTTGGGSGPDQPINSPWGMAQRGEDLFVSMAGMHQIWRVERETMAATPFAGGDAKGLFDGPVFDASLAQPAGLALNGDELAFVDSDSSSLRVIRFDTGEVASWIEGGLYSWGDRDGEEPELQFPRAVVWHGRDLIVADTYNDKIRRFRDGRLETLAVDVQRPEGLAIDGDILLVADTGNHRVLRVDLAADEGGGVVEVLEVRGLPDAPTAFGTEWLRAEPIRLPPHGDVSLRFPVSLAGESSLQYDTVASLEASNLEGHALVVDLRVRPDLDGEWFVARGIGTGDIGMGVVRLRLVYTTCDQQDQVCHVHERRLDVPVAVVSGADSDAVVGLG